ARPQFLVDPEHLFVAQPGQLGRAAQVLGKLRVRVLLGDVGLPFQRLGVDPQVFEPELATAHGLQSQLPHGLAGKSADLGHRRPSRKSSSGGAPGLTQARSSAIRAITVVWYLASIASSLYGLRAGSGVPPLACRAAFVPSSRYSSDVTAKTTE